MPFPFAELCTLFSRLEDIELHDPPLLLDEKARHLRVTVESWFKYHRSALNALTVEGAVGLISAFLPERRTDRVYGLQATSLCRILSRCLHLRTDRVKDLRAYTQPGRGDLGACLERVLASGGPPALPPVTIEEIDELFVTLAGHSRFSDPTVPQIPPGSSEAMDNLIGNLFKRLTTAQGKWLVRLVLKDLSPVKIDESLVLRSYHFLLPDLLRFQQNFEVAISLLKGPLREYPERPDPRSERLLRKQASDLIKPCVGVKVGRPTFHKARSIDHCLKMLGGKEWVLERKYDGEYCEIHIDLSWSSKPAECIKIYSKSGRDSTADRRGIHSTLVRCLHLGQPECKIRRRAILLGELTVWSDSKQEPLPFEKIKKFVTRSGVSIGTDNGSQRHPDEHLAIAFFDLLLLDDEIVMSKPINERRNWLRDIYTKIHGRALSAQWKVIDFAHTEKSRTTLLQHFAASNAGRCEGLVLKPCGMPYFALHSEVNGFRSGFIKLKSDYIAEMGDEADLAVMGASYDAQQALKSGLQKLKYTDFHLGALLNKEQVQRFNERPRFKLVGTIQQALCIPKSILQTANIAGALSAVPAVPGQQPTYFDLEAPTSCKIGFFFNKPLVFEVVGSGFEKPSNAEHFMLRHARVKKLHQDRHWKYCVSFKELQEQAAATRAAPVDSDSQETRRWLEKLERRCKKKFDKEKTASPRSCRSVRPRCGSASVNVQMPKKLAERHPLASLSSNSAVGNSRQSRYVGGDTSVLDGSTLVEQTPAGAKRARFEPSKEPHQPSKRPKFHYESSVIPDTPQHARENVSSVASIRASARPPRADSASARDAADKTTTSDTVSLPRNVFGALASLLPSNVEASNPRTAHASFCNSTACLFHAAALYLSPCIAHAPYIATDLLTSHHATLVPSLIHWNRDSNAHPPMTETVSESQSYLGQRKTVVVEGWREHAVQDVVQQVVGLNGGALRERVEIWDWRALEHAVKHGGGDGQAMREYFLGATVWDGVTDRAAFVWSRKAE